MLFGGYLDPWGFFAASALARLSWFRSAPPCRLLVVISCVMRVGSSAPSASLCVQTRMVVLHPPGASVGHFPLLAVQVCLRLSVVACLSASACLLQALPPSPSPSPPIKHFCYQCLEFGRWGHGFTSIPFSNPYNRPLYPCINHFQEFTHMSYSLNSLKGVI